MCRVLYLKVSDGLERVRRELLVAGAPDGEHQFALQLGRTRSLQLKPPEVAKPRPAGSARHLLPAGVPAEHVVHAPLLIVHLPQG